MKILCCRKAQFVLLLPDGIETAVCGLGVLFKLTIAII